MSGFTLPEIAPRLYTDTFPEAERSNVWLVEAGLHKLLEYEDDFRAALRLFDWASGEVPRVLKTFASDLAKRSQLSSELISFGDIAGRDSILTVYHFGVALKGVNDTAALSPTLFKMVDRKALKTANVAFFRKYFRNYREIRDAIGHSADPTSTPEKFAEHGFSGTYRSREITVEDSKNVIITGWVGRRYAMTWNREIIHSAELSQQSVDRLRLVRLMMWAAFKPAEVQTRALWLANRQGKTAPGQER